MLYLAGFFLAVALVAGCVGFGVAGEHHLDGAKVIALVFLLLSVIAFAAGSRHRLPAAKAPRPGGSLAQTSRGRSVVTTRYQLNGVDQVLRESEHS